MQKKDKRKIALIILGIIILIVVGLIFYKLFNDKKHIEHYVFTGVITNIYEKNLTVRDQENGAYYSVTVRENQYSIGDIIAVYTKDPIRESYPAQVIASKIEVLKKVNNTESNVTDESDQNDNTNTNNHNENTSSTNKNKDNIIDDAKVSATNEEEVIRYFSSLDTNLNKNDNSSSFSAKIKNSFVTGIDFLFYNGQIYNYRFDDLTTKAKLQILKIALSIDSKIDKLFPGYKEKLGNAYTNVKNKIVSTFLNITITICNTQNEKIDGQDICSQAKADFAELKKSFGLTWDFIAGLVKSGLSNLSEAYQIWKES